MKDIIRRLYVSPRWVYEIPIFIVLPRTFVPHTFLYNIRVRVRETFRFAFLFAVFNFTFLLYSILLFSYSMLPFGRLWY